MTEYLSKTSYWQALESLPVKISSPYDHKEFNERTTSAKCIGDERLKLFQLKFDFTRSSFPLEPGCVINDETGEYIGMLICTPKDHHSIILARPARFMGSFSTIPRVYGTNPFLRYEAWYSLPKQIATVTGLTKIKGINRQLSCEARSYELGCYKIFQFEASNTIFKRNHLTFISGCTVSDATGSYICLLVMVTSRPQIPVAITIKERSING